MNEEELVIRSARDLFFTNGIKNVSMADIFKKAGLPIKEFPDTNKSKSEIVTKVVDQVYSDAIQAYKDELSSHNSTRTKIQNFITIRINNLKGAGADFFNEVINTNDIAFRIRIEKRNREVNEVLIKFFQQAQKEGLIRDEMNLNVIPFLLNNLIRLYGDEELHDLYNSPEELIREVTNCFLFGILKEDEALTNTR